MKPYQLAIRESIDDEPSSFIPASPSSVSSSTSSSLSPSHSSATVYIPSPTLGHIDHNNNNNNNLSGGGGRDKGTKDYKHLSVVMMPEISHSPEMGTSQSYDSAKFKGINNK